MSDDENGLSFEHTHNWFTDGGRESTDDENGLSFEHTHNWFPVGVAYHGDTPVLTEVCQGGMVRADEDKCTAWRERELDYDDAVELVSTEEGDRGEIDGLLTGGSE